MTTKRKTILAVTLAALASAGCRTAQDSTTQPPQAVDAEIVYSYIVPAKVVVVR